MDINAQESGENKKFQEKDSIEYTTTKKIYPREDSWVGGISSRRIYFKATIRASRNYEKGNHEGYKSKNPIQVQESVDLKKTKADIRSIVGN